MHRKSLLKIFCFTLYFYQAIILINGQNPDDYNRIYTKTFLETAQQDFKRALVIADSLYSISETPKYKVRSLMLSASLLQQSGEIKKAVTYAVQAEMMLQNTEEYLWKAKVAGFLSSQYRILGLYPLSNKFTNQALDAVSHIEEPKTVNNIMGFIMQEKAYYEMDRKNYKKSLQHIKKSADYFAMSGNQDPFLKANNEQLAGLNYYYLQHYEKALFHYKRAKMDTEKMPDHFLKGLIYDGFAKIYTAKRDFVSAHENLRKAESISDQSNFLNLKNEVAKTSKEYYRLVKDTLKFHQAEEKQHVAAEKIATQSFHFMRDSFQEQVNQNEKKQHAESQDQYLIIGLIVTAFAFFAVVYYYTVHHNKKNNQSKAVLLSGKNVKKSNQSDPPSETEKTQTMDNQRILHDHVAMMTPETERKILTKLEKFEESLLFLRNTVSLPYVASYCNTNTKYLSYLINNFKHKDFNNYINELRINYIIDKLSHDPQYHKYKIAALAEEAGFSSQSKFAAAFKKITSTAPSQYLQNLRKE